MKPNQPELIADDRPLSVDCIADFKRRGALAHTTKAAHKRNAEQYGNVGGNMVMTFCPSCEKETSILKSGVCNECLSKFQKTHSRKISATPEPVDFTNLEPGTAFADGHGVERTEEFDYAKLSNWDEPDRGNPMSAEIQDAASADRIPELADGLAAILDFCWRTKSGDRRATGAAFNAFVALSACVNPALFDSMTYEEIGQEICGGLTRAALSKLAKNFEARFNLKFRRSRKATDSFSLAQAGNQNRRKSTALAAALPHRKSSTLL